MSVTITSKPSFSILAARAATALVKASNGTRITYRKSTPEKQSWLSVSGPGCGGRSFIFFGDAADATHSLLAIGARCTVSQFTKRIVPNTDVQTGQVYQNVEILVEECTIDSPMEQNEPTHDAVEETESTEASADLVAAGHDIG